MDGLSHNVWNLRIRGTEGRASLGFGGGGHGVQRLEQEGGGVGFRIKVIGDIGAGTCWRNRRSSVCRERASWLGGRDGRNGGTGTGLTLELVLREEFRQRLTKYDTRLVRI